MQRFRRGRIPLRLAGILIVHRVVQISRPLTYLFLLHSARQMGLAPAIAASTKITPRYSRETGSHSRIARVSGNSPYHKLHRDVRRVHSAAWIWRRSESD